MGENQFDNYVKDLILLIREQADLLKSDSKKDEFESGRAMAYYEILSLIKSQAVAFELPLDSLGIHDLDVSNYLMTKSDSNI